MEAGETIKEALYREVFEETGLVVKSVVKELLTVQWTDDQRGERWAQIGFLVMVEELVSVRLDPEEHDEWRWATKAEAETLSHLPGQAKLREAAFRAQAELEAHNSQP